MAGNSLWKSSNPSSWHKHLSAYETALQQLADKKKKKNLIPLDNWFQNKLGETIRSRNPPYMEKPELAKLMEWKLTRGKFRPQLPSLIESNSIEKVKSASEKSFQNISEPTAALKDLCELRGVGPATASAVLAAFSPEKYCFMADESVASVLPGKINYTLKYYLEYLDRVCEKGEELTKGDGGHVWTPHDVECALWSCTVSAMCGGGGGVADKGGKRKSEGSVDEKENTNGSKRSRKKLKS